MNALPKHARDDDFNLSALVRRFAENEPDPHKVAEYIVRDLSANHLRQALLLTLPDYVRKVRPNRPHGIKEGTGAPRSVRWDAAAAIRGEIAILRHSVFARGKWKFLGDCDRADCVDLAEGRERKAGEIMAEADRYREIADALRKRRKKTVRDLPVEVLETIFDA